MAWKSSKAPEVKLSPPPLAVRLLRLRLPDEISEAFIGDLTEEFVEQVAARGRGAATRWFWMQALRVEAGRLRKEASKLRRARAMRYGEDAPERAPSRVFSRTTTEMFGQDLRLAVRRLSARKGFTAVALLSLALGIGANTTVFSLVNSIFFQGSGVADPDRLVQMYYRSQSGDYWSMSEVQARAIGTDLEALFETVTFMQPNSGNIETESGPQVVFMNLVGPDFFRTLGRPPIMGRVFSAEEHEVDDAFPVAIISHGLWQRSFGSAPDIIGTNVLLNARRYTVVGVSDPAYRGPAGLLADVFTPLGTAPHLKDDSEDALVWTAFGRMRDGTTLAQVRSGLEGVGLRLSEDLPADAWQTRFSSELDSEVGLGPGVDALIRPMAALAMVAAFLVLLVACTNLAGFLLAQGTDRRKEFAVRLALGADRSRVVSQLVVEALLLGVMGGLLGIGVAMLLTGLLGNLNPPIGIPIHLNLTMDYRVVGFTFAVMLLASGIFGLLPALQSSSPDVAPTLRDESAGSGEGRGGARARRLIVIVQVAMSMVILVAAGLLVRSLQAQLGTDPGFQTEGISIVQVDAGPSGYEGDAELGALYDRLLQEAEALPGVTMAALASRLPLQVLNWHFGFAVPGVESPAGQDGFSTEVAYVSPAFFDLMEIPIVSGRAFGPEDRRGEPGAVIVNEAMSRRLWPDRDPVGATIHDPGEPLSTYTVVGVAAQTKVDRLGEGDGAWFIYRPIAQSPTAGAKLLTRGSAPSAESAGRTLRMIKDVDPNLFVPQVGTMRDHVGVLLYLPRLGTLLLAAFGLLALVLAASGLYGIVSFTVARRTREVGIRISLGARGDDVVRLMMQGGIALVGLGAVVGLGLSLAGGRLMQGFLFGVNSWDPITLISVPMVLGVVGLLASWLPARRASRVDPVRALRAE